MKKSYKTLALLPVLLLGACNNAPELSVEEANERLNGIVNHVLSDEYSLPENITLNISARAYGDSTDSKDSKKVMVDTNFNGKIGVNLKDLIAGFSVHGDILLPTMAVKERFDLDLYAYIENNKAVVSLNDGLDKTYMEIAIPSEYVLFTKLQFTSPGIAKDLFALNESSTSEHIELDNLDLSMLTNYIGEYGTLKFRSSGEGNFIFESDINPGDEEKEEMFGSLKINGSINDYRFDKIETTFDLTEVIDGTTDHVEGNGSIRADYSTVVTKTSLDGYTKVDVIDFSAINNLFDGILDVFLY